MYKPPIIYQIKEHAERIIERKIVFSARFPFIKLHKRFLSVRMDITSRCNLACIICPRSQEDPKTAKNFDMEWPLFSKIAEEVFPRTSELFLSCGSEPLMARHFRDVLNVTAKAEIPFVSFTTNALLLNEDNARSVINSGVKEVEVSFDGATEATFAKIRGGASMLKVIENVETLNELKESLSSPFPEVVFHITLMRSNIREISKIIEIAHDLKISSVKALHLYSYPSLGNAEESLYNHKDLYDTCIAAADKRAKELGVDFSAPSPFGKTKHDGRSAIAENFQNSTCIFPWTMMRISTSGSVFPCATWMETEPFGDLNEQHFLDIWHGQQYRQLRKKMRDNKPPGACENCPTKILFSSAP